MRRRTLVWAPLVLAAGSGCWEPVWPAVSDAGVPGTGEDASILTGDFTWYQDVLPIVERNCGLCHGAVPRLGAGYSLSTYTDTQIFHTSQRPMHQVMAERLMMQTDGQMPPPSRPSLSTRERDILVAWSAGGAPMGTPTTQVTWYEDIEPIVRTYCQQCHGDPLQFGAPRAFLSYEDVTEFVGAQSANVYEMMAARVTSEGGTLGAMPPPSQPQLTSAQISAIVAWAEAGAPAGDPANRPDGGTVDAGPVDSGPGVVWLDGGSSGSTGDPDTRWVDTFAFQTDNPIARYPMPQRETVYSCWSFQVPTSTTADQEHITYIEWIIDNPRFVHHLMIFIDDSGLFTDPDPAGPFDCEGFPYEGDPGNPTQQYAEYVDGWFPGRLPTEMPDGIGIRVRPGDRLVLQAHYDNVTEADLDQSGIRVLLDRDPTLQEAATLWSGVVWPGPINGTETRQGDCELQQDITAFRVFPHMHNYGTRIVSEVQRGGTGPWQVLAEISPWNFDDQPILDIPEDRQQLRAGDILRTQCYWNTMGRDVYQGDGSLDEMCFSVFFHYPPHPNTGPGGFCVD